MRFQHRGVFSVCFDEPGIERRWDTNLTFTLYSRKSHQMKVNVILLFTFFNIKSDVKCKVAF